MGPIHGDGDLEGMPESDDGIGSSKDKLKLGKFVASWGKGLCKGPGVRRSWRIQGSSV
jgi:hypothetical protein